MDFQYLFAVVDGRRVNDHAAVEPPGAQECGVEDVRTVRRRDDDNGFVLLKTVHLDEDLIQGLFALIVSSAEPGAAMPPHRVNLVHENNGRRGFFRNLKEIPYAAVMEQCRLFTAKERLILTTAKIVHKSVVRNPFDFGNPRFFELTSAPREDAIAPEVARFPNDQIPCNGLWQGFPSFANRPSGRMHHPPDACLYAVHREEPREFATEALAHRSHRKFPLAGFIPISAAVPENVFVHEREWEIPNECRHMLPVASVAGISFKKSGQGLARVGNAGCRIVVLDPRLKMELLPHQADAVLMQVLLVSAEYELNGIARRPSFRGVVAEKAHEIRRYASPRRQSPSNARTGEHARFVHTADPIADRGLAHAERLTHFPLGERPGVCKRVFSAVFRASAGLIPNIKFGNDGRLERMRMYLVRCSQSGDEHRSYLLGKVHEHVPRTKFIHALRPDIIFFPHEHAMVAGRANRAAEIRNVVNFFRVMPIHVFDRRPSASSKRKFFFIGFEPSKAGFPSGGTERLQSRYLFQSGLIMLIVCVNNFINRTQCRFSILSYEHWRIPGYGRSHAHKHLHEF